MMKEESQQKYMKHVQEESFGHEKKTEGGVLENYTMRAEKDLKSNLHIKTICDPTKKFGFTNPHSPIYKKGFYNLNENGEISKYALTREVLCNKIRINHYFTKSKEEYIKKISRGMADNKSFRNIKSFIEHDQNIVKDTTILFYK